MTTYKGAVLNKYVARWFLNIIARLGHGRHVSSRAPKPGCTACRIQDQTGHLLYRLAFLKDTGAGRLDSDGRVIWDIDEEADAYLDHLEFMAWLWGAAHYCPSRRTAGEQMVFLTPEDRWLAVTSYGQDTYYLSCSYNRETDDIDSTNTTRAKVLSQLRPGIEALA